MYDKCSLHSSGSSNHHQMKVLGILLSSMDQEIIPIQVHRTLQQAQQTVCHKEQLHLHHGAPSQAGGPPQAPPVNHQDAATREGSLTHPYQQQNQNTGQNHQGLPDCNGTTSRSTSTPKDSGKGPRPQQGKKKSSEPCPSMSTGTDYTSQDTGPSRHQIQCLACGEYSHWSKDCPYYNFYDICKVTTHSTYVQSF